MAVTKPVGLRPVRMGRLTAETNSGSDGVIYVRASSGLGPYARTTTDALRDWAERVPDRVFLADRGSDGEWRRVSYADALAQMRSIAQYLLELELSPERPIVVLSGNSLEHALVGLAAMMIGVPYAPISPAYSLVSKDFGKLRHIFDLLTPGLVFVAEGKPFERALRAVLKPGMALMTARDPVGGFDALRFADALACEATTAVDAANASVSPDTIGKFLFTSGSTGSPKAVVNTQRMICCNQEMIASALAFLRDEPPVMVDWLPWNHTAGGNHNFGIVLFNGGSLYIDDGSPTPDGIKQTVRNLREIAPTLYFNVPKGFEMLSAYLESDERLRSTFFSRVMLLQYAGAGLAQHVWDSLEQCAVETCGEKIMIVTGYGSTETAPFASTTTWPVGRPGEIGLPAPGLEMKLVPNGEKLELRLRGPSVTPGYWRQPDLTAQCFDEEGFYRIGDAVKFVDPRDIGKGLLFDGRISEDFKLSTGTWVNMAAVRAAAIQGFAPYVRDAVVTGLNRGHVGVMLFLDNHAAPGIATDLSGASDAELARHPAVRAFLQDRLDDLATQSTGSSTHIARAVVLDTPPDPDSGEITDKGSINQRAVMAARADLVESLYEEPIPAHVLVARLS